jgi:hypothetical protein
MAFHDHTEDGNRVLLMRGEVHEDWKLVCGWWWGK